MVPLDKKRESRFGPFMWKLTSRFAPSFGNARLALDLDIGGRLDPIGVGTEGVCGFRALVGPS